MNNFCSISFNDIYVLPIKALIKYDMTTSVQVGYQDGRPVYGNPLVIDPAKRSHFLQHVLSNYWRVYKVWH